MGYYIIYISLLIFSWFNPLLTGFLGANLLTVPYHQFVLQAPPTSPNYFQSLDGQVHGIYFYSKDCPHCYTVLQEVIKPMQTEYGNKLDLRLLETSNPDYYALLIEVEDYFKIAQADRSFPTLIIGDEILIGEDNIRARLPEIVQQSMSKGGLDWTPIPGLDPAILISDNGMEQPTDEGVCKPADPDACAQTAPIYAAYFYQVGCQACSRVDADLKYTRSLYPQFVVEKFNLYEHPDLGAWLARRAGREDLHAPALFIGDKVLIGEEEISAASIETIIKQYADKGSEKVWEKYDPAADQGAFMDQFRSMGWLTVGFAGLIDGLNPCAFATLIFFVSYLTINGKRGREVLLVGGAFTVGVFLAYLAVGVGFYKVLDALGSWLTVLGRWVYALTALFCFVLAFFAFRDFLKARKGNLKDMELNLPHALRSRINAVIRQGRNMRTSIVGAFLTGIVVSFLELACTGQIYLPTIIFMRSQPELRLQATLYLLLYNLLFILPLVVVFFLAYFGTTSKDLTRFLEHNASTVKLGMVILFVLLGAWLVFSLFA